MNKFFLLPLLLLIFSCGSQTPEPVEARAMDSNFSANMQEDTIIAFYSLKKATEEDFNKAAANRAVGFSMEQGDAQKRQSVITLKINGEWKAIGAFKDTLLGTNNPAKREYKYLGQNKKLNKYLIAGFSNTNYQTYLVDKSTAGITSLWAEPSIAPDYKLLATMSPPTGKQPSPNGLQVWKLGEQDKSNSFEKLFEIDQHDWVPVEMQWESSRIIILKVIPFEKHAQLQTGLEEQDFSYLRLKIK